jgi:hypothetical protein
VTQTFAGNELAPSGFVWCCMACGKRSRDLYGYQVIDRGYDASCMLNAQLVDEAAAAAMWAHAGECS